MYEPPPETQRRLTLMAWEVCLRVQARDGGTPSDAVRWCVTRLALNAPELAVRLPHVRALLDPHVLSALVSAARGTRFDTQAEQAAGSPVAVVPVGSGQAAQMLGITPRGVRVACLRGLLPAAKDQVTGEWLIKVSDLEEYGRRHGQPVRNEQGRPADRAA